MTVSAHNESARPLEGLGVLLTRPRAQAEPVAAQLREAGAEVIVFPTLEIVGTSLSRESEAALASLAEASLAVFVSANAVEHGLAAAVARGPWPGAVRAATVGQATANRLRAEGLPDVIAPTERFDSEALLALIPDALVAGRRVLIFRGVGGRDHLRASLEARGARVAYVECYRRERPASDPGPLLAALGRGEIAAVHAMSAETVDNFLALAGSSADWKTVALVVPHPAIARNSCVNSFGRVVVTGPGNNALVQALVHLQKAS